MRNIIGVICGVLILTASCNGPDDKLVNCEFDQTEMLTNYSDNIIIPRFENLNAGLALLDASVQTFVANPSPGLLVEIRVTFGATYLAYEDCGTFAFGPGLIGGVPFRERFNTFPTNTIAIEQNIADEVAIASSAKSAVGFPAMEYLIFGDGTLTNQEVTDLFTTGVSGDARKAYLQGLVSEMKTTVSQINLGWDSYRTQFISNVGTAEGTSISLLVNELNFDFETLKNFKFKIPLGKFNGGTVIPESVEAYYADGSAQLAVRHLTGLKRMYGGIGENGADNLGIQDYLACVRPLTDAEVQNGGITLADDIAAHFVDIQAAMELIPDPMSETLVSNKQIVDDAYLEMQMLVPMIKSDMTSALGVQINYQDNDGD
ncbi:MAG: imelysin family protein [Flavobacteriales bacterium]|nr:imelysin family protein [Flavobacteriales bacterium]